MNAIIRLYKVPIIISALSAIGLAGWLGFAPTSIKNLGQKQNSRLVAGICDIVESTLQSLSIYSNHQEITIQRVMENIVANSPLNYIILQEDGKHLIHTSLAPRTIHLPQKEGQRFNKSQFVYWRTIRLSRDALYDKMFEVETRQAQQTGSEIVSFESVLILGGKIPKDEYVYKKLIKGYHFTLAVTFLFVAASALAWILAIRNRLLGEQLISERLRLAHLEELGLAAAGLAHETKNPLGLISGIAQQILRGHDVPLRSRRMFEQIIDEVDNATARLGHFMTFARLRNVTPTVLNASEVITDVTRVLKAEFDAYGVGLITHCPRIQILADEEMLKQILVNLLMNSLHASSEGGRVIVRMTASRGCSMKLAVEDQGRGIPPELKPNIFKPYISGYAKGHGLGLAIVKRHVENHDWTIQISSELNQGTLVVISGIMPAPPE